MERTASTASGPHHRKRRFMRMAVAAILAEEGHEHGAPDVEGRHAGSDHADPVHPRGMREGGGENGVLAEEAREGRNAGDGQRRRRPASRR